MKDNPVKALTDVAVLTADRDPMGAAIADYWQQHRAARLRVFSTMFDEDELPVKTLFRTEAQMSPIEQKALSLARGHVLDVGAGSGCHTLALQAAAHEVTAIDISPLSVATMRDRGVCDARLMNFFDPALTGPFDTLLMLMNGSGIVGRLSRWPAFLLRVKQLLAPGGCLLLDSSDLRYLYENEDGSIDLDLTAGYYGEVDYRMQYKQVVGEAFDWLYIDFATLKEAAAHCGFVAEKLLDGSHYDYLARLTLQH